MIMKLFKKIWHDPVGSQIIGWGIIGCLVYILSLASTPAKNILLYSIPIWLVLICIFIACLLARLWTIYSKKEREKKQEEKRKLRANEIATQEHRDSIWSVFSGLDANDLKMLLKLYKIRSFDPENEYKRMLPKIDFYVYESILEKTKIKLSVSDPYRPTFHVCVTIKSLGDNIILNFDSYFYKLLKNYAETGEKKKL